MGVARTVYIRRASPVFCLLLLFMQPLVFYSEYQPCFRFLRFLWFLRFVDAHGLVPPVSVRHVRPMLSVSLFDTSV